jgi:uncharacterized protein YdeI (YjbR/CyaY-like superfamily)
VAPTPPNDKRLILQWPSAEHWEQWLDANHADSSGVWLKFAKKSSPTPTVSHAEALEVAMCFGWIDGQTRAHDEFFWLQRFTPRGPRSKWSQINRDKATELIAADRMRAAGHAQVKAAKGDGRWEAAYEPQSRATVPEDFRRALQEHPEANAFFKTLRGANRYALLHRLHHVTKPEARAKRIADYITMLTEHRTLH